MAEPTKKHNIFEWFRILMMGSVSCNALNNSGYSRKMSYTTWYIKAYNHVYNDDFLMISL